MADRDWNILLIGGASTTGKSALGAAIAGHFRARYIDLDLFWIVLQRALPASVAPDLHLFEPDSAWLLPVEELVERYKRVAAAVCHAIEPVVAHHDVIDTPAVIEGCWLLPAFAMQRTYAGRNVARLGAIYLVEPELGQLDLRIAARSNPPSLFRTYPEAQRNHAVMQHLYGLEIKRQAEALNLPVLESRPFDTLLDRALAVLKPSP